jgi:DeoR/GlpR family transcriptional regulator of sugar metabolism
MTLVPAWASSQERREKLLAQLRVDARSSVGELSQLLGVSEVTVRKDLDLLENQGLLTRVHGGAVISSRGRLLLYVTEREKLQNEEKRRIAQAAIRLVHPDQTIFLDASTTALQMVRLLHGLEGLTLVTNGLYTALEASFYAGITVIDIGGIVKPRSSSVTGNLNYDLVRRLHFDIGFFGACGITARNGLTEIDLDEAQIKQHMVQISDRVVCVADSTKLGDVHVHAFALPEDVDHIISDTGAPADVVAELRALDLAVELV